MERRDTSAEEEVCGRVSNRAVPKRYGEVIDLAKPSF